MASCDSDVYWFSVKINVLGTKLIAGNFSGENFKEKKKKELDEHMLKG